MGTLVQVLWQIFLGLVARYCACLVLLRYPNVPVLTAPMLAHVEGLPERDGDDDDSN